MYRGILWILNMVNKQHKVVGGFSHVV